MIPRNELGEEAGSEMRGILSSGSLIEKQELIN